MDMQQNESSRPINPRRRKRTKAQIFKEAYLPVIIAAAAVVMILIFIIGSITRAVQRHQLEKQESIAASMAAEEQLAQLALQEQTLLTQAQALADGFDYDGAIALLDSFSGDINSYPTLSARRAEYVAAKSELVPWGDPGQVTNLSFQLLVADLQMGLSHSTYAGSINRNFITTGEFSAILRQLYDNGYILVSLEDLFETQTDQDGQTVYTAKTLYLPVGKKPIMLTQTNVNYNYYLIDSDGDKLPDKDGGGFASKLLLTENGDLTCQMVNADGQTVTGAFDMVPILEDFIAAHPDFSYCGARAVLALTGYNGLFGYRTETSQEEVQAVQQLAEALTQRGYTLACYTYENIPYGTSDIADIQADLNQWTSLVVPILGQLDTLVYAQNTDISDDLTYSGEKYALLAANGFRCFLGFCQEGRSWASVQDDYVRQGRILVTGSNLKYHPEWFGDLFDAASVLDSARGEIPE